MARYTNTPAEREVISTLARIVTHTPERLSARDYTTADDLVGKTSRWGASEAQLRFISSLIARANGQTPQRPTEALSGDVAGIFALFAQAQRAGLKFPKIRLTASDETPVVLGMAGPRSKYAGAVQITDGGPFESNRYFGRISPEGGLTAGRDMTPAVRDLLTQFAAEPAKVATAYGRRTGSCCFCRKELTTAESRSVGYGPVCAEKFGLPWGEVDPAVTGPVVVTSTAPVDFSPEAQMEPTISFQPAELAPAAEGDFGPATDPVRLEMDKAIGYIAAEAPEHLERALGHYRQHFGFSYIS